MPWGAQQWLRLTKETAYGVRQSTPPGTDILYIRLYSDNAFTMRPVPQRQVIRTADAGNRRRQVVAGRKVYSGALNTLFYPSQAPYLLTAATALTSNDLTSYTVDYFDTVRVQGYLGCKIQSLGITSNATQDYGTLALQIVGQQLDSTFTVFAQPADSTFPTEVPYEHTESAGLLSIGGSTITKYSALGLTITNVLVSTWDELAYITGLYYCGRDVDISVTPQYITTTNRTAYEAQTALSVSVGWSRTSPAHAVTINCESKNYISSLSDQLPLAGVGYQPVTIQTFYDGSASADIAVTAS
jgi:hypothetical protein